MSEMHSSGKQSKKADKHASRVVDEGSSVAIIHSTVAPMTISHKDDRADLNML